MQRASRLCVTIGRSLNPRCIQMESSPELGRTAFHPRLWMSAAPAEADEIVPSRAPSEKIVRLCDELCSLNVIEMNDLVSTFKKKVGLSDMDVMPMMGAMAPNMPASPASVSEAAGDAAPEKEEVAEKAFFDLKLMGFDAKSKIKVIKEVRAITGLGLKEAKELVESAPKTIKKELSKEAGEELLAKLKAVDADVSLE